MDKEDILKGVYDDFFGIEKLIKENEDLYNQISEIPSIDVKRMDTMASNEISDVDKNLKMQEFFEKIDDIYINENSKNIFKKIIEYARKYMEKKEEEYIEFNIYLNTNNTEVVNDVKNVLYDSFTYFNYIKKGNIKDVSLYDLDKIDDLDKIYENTSLVVFNNFEKFNSKDNEYRDKFMYKLEKNIEKNVNVVNILVNTTSELVKELKEKFFEFEIIGTNPDVQDVYQEVLSNLNENFQNNEEFKIKLLDYITITYPNNNLPYPDYRDKLCNKIIFENKVPDYEKEKSIVEILKELNELVGLQKVKEVINDLINLIELKNKTKDDLKLKNVNLHMVFLGNPGTGKTTVARIIAEILYNLKYIRQNKLVEVSSKDLVAEYVGQTAPKTMSVIEKALGGVLFIDEAYSLASGNGQGSSYNEEAIATLIQSMENYREDFVVIFAGYTKEMQAFLDSNSGIVSRIGYTVEFEDYTVDELIKIFNQMMQKAGFKVTESAIDKVRELINEYKDSKNFGNARFIRNVYEKSILKHASNTRNIKKKSILKTIDEQDISAENLLKM